ncbi:MAG: hypothetical protein ACOVJ1_07385 [Sediminibacterium sp.]|jgi:hypothetical protein
MKNLVVLFVLLLQLPLQAQSPNQAKVLESAVMQFNQANNPSSYKQLYLQFEQLYSVDKTNWLIPYYAGMTKSIMCLLKMGDRDALANDALLWVARAKAIEVNDEIYCAESLAYTAKMSVNPALRWFTYEGKIKNTLSLAKKLNPSNPRAYVLEANIQQKLPFIFGGGCKSAKPLIQKAELFISNQNRANSIEPSWGIQSLVKLKKACPF